MEFPGHHFTDRCSSPTYWYKNSALVSHVSSLWESSLRAKYGQRLLWASGILRMLPFTVAAGLHWTRSTTLELLRSLGWISFSFFSPITPLPPHTHTLKYDPGRKGHRRQRTVVCFSELTALHHTSLFLFAWSKVTFTNTLWLYCLFGVVAIS